MLNNAWITVSTCRWETRNCLYKAEKLKWQAPTLLHLVLIFISDLMIFQKKMKLFLITPVFLQFPFLPAFLTPTMSTNKQWVKLEMLRLKVDFLCREKLVDDLLSSLRRNLNNVQMPTEGGLLLWDTTSENHTESYMPWQLVLTIVKVKANKQVQ